jgi:peptidoglycan/LPS O-acetylase OafA/YrhL
MKSNTSSRVNEIDFLRFFAAIAVVFWHYAAYGFASGRSPVGYPLLAPVASFGFYGVNLFFMISGFVILMTASDGNLAKFISSRITRLYPAFWVCCTITLVVILLADFSDVRKTLSLYVINMTMLSGFFKVASLDGSYWSLFVEIQFYAFIACLLFFKQIKHAELYIIAWLISNIGLLAFNYNWMHHLLITDYASYFIAGAAFFLIWKEGLSLTRAAIVSSAYGLSIYKLIARNGSNFQYVTFSQDHIFIACIIITICFIVFSLISLKKTGAFGQHQWLKLGALTYPLYLIHQTVGFKIFNALFYSVNLHLLFWGTTILMIALSYWISQSVEKTLASWLKKQLAYFSHWSLDLKSIKKKSP